MIDASRTSPKRGGTYKTPQTANQESIQSLMRNLSPIAKFDSQTKKLLVKESLQIHHNSTNANRNNSSSQTQIRSPQQNNFSTNKVIAGKDNKLMDSQSDNVLNSGNNTNQ